MRLNKYVGLLGMFVIGGVARHFLWPIIFASGNPIPASDVNKYFKAYYEKTKPIRLESIFIDNEQLEILNRLNPINGHEIGYRIYGGIDNTGEIGMAVRVINDTLEDYSRIIQTNALHPCPTICDSKSIISHPRPDPIVPSKEPTSNE